jgi:hypothetical protein
MLNLTMTEIVFLITARLRHLQEACGMNLQEAAADDLMQKLAAERKRLETAEKNAAEASNYEAEHAAKLAKLDSEYPVAVGDTAEVAIGSRTYRAVVKYRSETPAGMAWEHNARQLSLVILRRDGQPNKAMNGTRGAWAGLVRKQDIRKTA